MSEAGLEPVIVRSTVHCLIHYATKEDMLTLMKKLKVNNCKGDKSIPPFALVWPRRPFCQVMQPAFLYREVVTEL